MVHEVPLTLEDGATLAFAIKHSGLHTQFPEIDISLSACGVWGVRAGPNQLLRDRDRIEIYRQLKTDPKAARRERFVRQGVRAAGLFTKNR
jgi:putative ubiquitin-RnfH superfamily antitoxin RatB of RatAB toxin-antitoxin module